MEQLQAYDCHENMTAHQATEYHKNAVYTNCESGLAQEGPAHTAGRGGGMDK